MPRGVYNRKSIENKTMYFVKSRYDTSLYENEDELLEFLEGEGFNLDGDQVIYKITSSKKMVFKRPLLAGMLVEV